MHDIAQFGRMLLKSDCDTPRVFIHDQMRLSQIYQPVMLLVLMERGHLPLRVATRRQSFT